MNFCVILECGWIIKGIKDIGASSDTTVILHDACVVRSWHNGKGIGGIAKSENKNEYILDKIGDVEIQKSKVLFAIPCEW